MRTLRNRVAVVTGAASGIGRALVERFVTEGARIVLADVEREPLAAIAKELESRGVPLLARPTDVSRAADVEALAEAAQEHFGAIDVVCNNAGVSVSGLAWEHSEADWQWVLGVNLLGVVNGIRSFVPRMLAQRSEGHVVNTASLAGLTSNPNMAAYNVSKHGVVTLSETLQKDLLLVQSPLRVSVVCPGFVRTRILDSARNRPAGTNRGARPSPGSEPSAMRSAARVEMEASAVSPEHVADRIVRAIFAERFYVYTHDGWEDRVRERFEDILGRRTPDPLARLW